MKKHGQQFTSPVDFTGAPRPDADPIPCGGAVQHPPREASNEIPPLALDTHTAMKALGNEWPLIIPRGIDSPKGALDALDRFVQYHSADLYPPLLILDWLASGIEAWFEAKGTRTLDQCLGLAVGKGQQPAYAAAATQYHKTQRMSEMSQLIAIFNVTPTSAAEMVAARLQDPPGQKYAFEASSLERWWYGAPGAIWRDVEYLEERKAELRAMSVADRRAQLACYPRHSFEHLGIDPVDSD